MPKRILVVDDEDFMVELLESQLQSLGFECDSFTDAAEALSFFNANSDTIDLAIVDLVMPGYSGTQLAEHMRQTASSLPVILMTGRMDAEGLGYTILEKPFTKALLLSTIQDLLGP